jgi:hypothetical protein
VFRLVSLAALLLVAGCSDDGETSTTSATSNAGPTTTLEILDEFTADDVAALCADLEGLGDIDPDGDPTQTQVDRLLAIAETAPDGVAGPLRAVAAYGQAVVDGEEDLDDLRGDAVDGATLLIAYGNEACQIDVPLFDSIAGV